MTRISIDLARRLGTVDRRIFGQFIEHIGRCIYGGVYDEGSPLADARGFRRDVLDAARPLRIPILRWPGGNFVSGYHWLDGVGPRDRRPRRSELAWYAEESNRFGTDELIGCGQYGWSEWDEITLSGLAELIDFHSIHLYTGGPDHYATVFQSHQAERAIRICSALIERVRYAQRIAHPIHIAFDEWNVWWRTRSHEDRVGGVEERYNLSDALAVATYLNGFIRHCRTVRIANFAQLVNAIAPIFTNASGLFLQAIYHPLRLYAEHVQDVALDVHVDGETYALKPDQESPSGRVHNVGDLGPFTLVDASATCDEAGRAMAVALVNRDRDHDLPVTLDLGGAVIAGAVNAWEVNGADVTATNSFETPRAVEVREHKLEARGARLETVLPAHSVTMLRLEVTRR